MSKKPRGKSGSAAGTGGSKWEAGLVSAPIEEDGWTLSITMAVADRLEDNYHLDMLAVGIKSEARKLFGVVHKQSLYDEVHEWVKELGNPKNKKGKDSPPFVEICETVKPVLDNGDELPMPLIARLIKFKILHLKQLDGLRIAAEKKAAIDKEKGGAGGKGKGKDKPKSAGKKGKGGKTPEPPSAKGGTKLKKRGEEDEKVYLDDEPLDGTSFYIVVCGFNQSHLLTHLADVGVFCDSVIKVTSDSYPKPLTPPPVDPNAPPKDDKTLALEEDQKQKRLKAEKELATFWRDYLLLINNAADSSKLHDMAVDTVTIQRDWLPENMEDDKDGEKKLTFGRAVFEEVAVKAYDILDLKRQHKNFLASLKLIHVPFAQEPQEQDAAHHGAGEGQTSHSSPEVDMRYYSDLMNCIPQESVSVPLIMHCMLEQIEATEQGKEPPSEVPPPVRPDGLDHGLAKHIGGLAFKLALTQQEKETLKGTFEEPKKPDTTFTQPELINSSDAVRFRTGHLATSYGFDPLEAEKGMLERLPIISSLETPDLEDSNRLERAARLQELLHFCVNENLKPDEVDRIFKQFVFECMDLTQVDEDGEITPPQYDDLTAIPWDDPYPYYRAQLPPPPEPEKLDEDDDILSELSASPLPSDRAETPSSVDLTSLRQDGGLAGLEKPKVEGSSAGSRPSSGILKKDQMKDGSIGSRPSSRNSVHFSDAGRQPGDKPDIQELLSTCNPMEELVPAAHKRNLDEFNFAENFDREILLQVMREASFSLPYVDIYYHKRDHSLLVVMHNPHNPELQSTMSWNTKVHTNIGLRNYQEYVAPLIVDWTTSEEAKYQATLISDDVEQDLTDIAKAEAAAAKDSKKGARSRSKSPRPGRKGSAKSQSPKPVDGGVNNYITDAFVKEGSLKYQKAEQERLNKEREEEERLKAEKADKRGKSGKKTADSQKGSKKDDRKLSSKASKNKVKDDPPAETEAPEHPSEPFIPFMGYDLGTSKLMHVDGKVQTLFPTDGAIIRTEKYTFTQGSTSVKSSVVKDGNVFSVHVLDPTDHEHTNPTEHEDNGAEKADTEENEKGEKKDALGLGRFAAFTAHFKDGMSFSLSTNGPQGVPSAFKKYTPEAYAPPVSTPASPAPDIQGAKGSPTKKGKKTGNTTPDPTLQDEVSAELTIDLVDPAPEAPPPAPFQPLYMTCPDGLSVGFTTEPNPQIEGEHRLLVKQTYPFKTSGKNECEKARAVPAMKEISRVIRCDGTVVKNMSNGDCTIYYADGAVSKLTGVPQSQNILQRSQTPNRANSARSQAATPTRKGRKGKDQKMQQSAEEIEALEAVLEFKGQWMTTSPTGERHAKKLDGTALPSTNLLVSYASDPESGQMIISREDHVSIVTYPQDMKVVEHEDGTRITTFLKELEQTADDNNEEMKESKGRGTPAVFKQQFIRVECPGYAAVEFNCYTSYCMVQFGSGTLMSVTPAGSYHIYHTDGFNMEVDSSGRVLYVPSPTKQYMGREGADMAYLLSHNDQTIISTIDPSGNMFTVQHDGENRVKLSDNYKNSIQKNIGQVQTYEKQSPRFFIVNRDLSGTELLRDSDIQQYFMESEMSRATAVVKEPVIEYPGVTAITILKPYLKNISQKWFGSFSAESIIPPGLKSRDLKTLPPREIKSAGPRFGMNAGKGLAIGSMEKQTSVDEVLDCPAKLEIRQFIQYKLVAKETRQGLCGNLKLYGDFVCARDAHAAEIQPADPRSEEDKMSSAELLKSTRKMLDESDLKSLYERVTAPVIPPQSKMSVRRRTSSEMERDRLDLQHEMRNKKALKNKEIPSYFESELGKQFLLSNASDPQKMLAELSGEKPPSKPNKKNQSEIRTNQSKTQTKSENPSNSSDGGKPKITSPGAHRPENPTPAQANQTGAKQSQRPNNPTPAHAGTNQDQITRTTPQTVNIVNESAISAADAIGKLDSESPRFGPLSAPNSLNYNVIGAPRTEPVHVPDYLTKSGKGSFSENEKFSLTEENARRQVKTSSVAMKKTRGFELLPELVDFGTLKEGNTYSFIVFLKNVGVDLCRYKLKQPPPSTGLKLIYVPGPIAAGMKAEIKLELYAIANGVVGETGVGKLSHVLEIVTETSIISLPVYAIIMTADEFERNESELVRGGRKPGVNLITDKPPNGYGITRPRKDLKVASNGSDAILSMT